MKEIYGFLLAVWALILAGGGIAVTILGPISVTGFGDLDPTISSGLKGVTAVFLVVIWVVVLHRIKNWIFKKRIT